MELLIGAPSWRSPFHRRRAARVLLKGPGHNNPFSLTAYRGTSPTPDGRRADLLP